MAAVMVIIMKEETPSTKIHTQITTPADAELKAAVWGSNNLTS